MAPAPFVETAGTSFSAADATALGEAVHGFLNRAGRAPRLLAFGEPLHGEEEFLRLRNGLFRYLVEHAGYRSIAIESSCLRGRLVDAHIQDGAGDLDQSFARDVAMTIVELGEAYVQCNEINEAARLLGDAGEIAAGNSSIRLIERLEQARAGMQPWQHTAAVRTLDERLVSYGLV